MKTPPTLSQDRAPILGAGFGALAWLCYGALELCAIAILPGIVEPAYEYRAYDSRFNALVLGLYTLAGAGIGFLCGVVFRKLRRFEDVEPAAALRAVNSAILTSILIGNVAILRQKSPFSPTILVVNLMLLLAAAVWSSGDGRVARFCRPFAAAWLPSATYLGCQWLAGWMGSGPSGMVELRGSLLIAALWAAAWIVAKLARPQGRETPWRALAGSSAFALGCCAATVALRPAVYVTSEAAVAPASGKPNIILISLDTVRADHLSVYGYGRETTPRLKEFARESTVFTRAIASSDMTLPSHGSLFTGMYPSQHGAHFSREHRLGAPLDPRFPTLAEMLRGKGYWTAGVIANGGYLSVAFGLHRGFAYWDQRLPPVALAPTPQQYLRGRLRDIISRLVPISEMDRVSRSARDINDAARAALDRRPRDGRPFFLFVNYMDAHVPYIPPAPYDSLFPGKDAGFTESRYMSTYRDVIAGNRQIGGRAQAHLVSQYDGGIAYLDAQLGALFGRLKAAGLYENSLIVVTSDHGEALGERNCMDHGGMSLYEDQIHVPLLIKYPGRRPAAVVAEPVSSVDLLPTVLEIVGAPVPKGVAGLSLAAPIPQGREVVSESFPGGRAYFTNATRFDRTHRSIISASMKFIAPSAGKPELYDLQRDPFELVNLYDPGTTESRGAAERLIAWLRVARGRPEGPVKIDRETMERLRSLGYVGQ